MITVLMTVYNGERYIAQSIQSILRQSFQQFELLIVDDGSTDRTKEIIHGFSDERIRVITLPHKGRGTALNEGILNARYEIIALQDADDLSLPLRLERQYKTLAALPDNTIVSSWAAFFHDDSILYVFGSIRNSSEQKKRLALTCDFSNASIMFHKNTIVSGGLYKNIPHGLEDYELFLRLKDSISITVIPEIHLFYRYHNASLSNITLVERYRLQYRLQEPFQENALREFGFSTNAEVSEYYGWREYFYGKKKDARRIWRQQGLALFLKPRVVIAFIVTFLPFSTFIRFKEARLKFRLKYLLTYLSGTNRKLRENIRDFNR